MVLWYRVTVNQNNKEKRLIMVKVVDEKPFNVWVPLPPTANHLYVKGRGRVRISEAGHNWFATAIELVRARPDFAWNKYGEGQKVRVDHVLVAGDNRSWDLDNRDKALYDLLEKSGLLFNDVQVFAGFRQKFLKQNGGQNAGAYVTVTRLPGNYGKVFILPTWCQQ